MIKYLNLTLLSLLFSGFLLITNIAMAAETTEGVQSLSTEDQNIKALEAFNQILELTEDSTDRASILKPLEAAYRDIISKYPKAVLSQECYWRLVMIYINEYNPPLFEKAEQAYDDFIKKYPDSQVKNLIAHTLTDAFYKQGKWDKLLKFYAPAIKEFIRTEKLAGPSEMFLYSEAKFHTGDLVEAEKGYKIVIDRFPGSRDSSISKKRLEEIKDKKSKAK